MCSGRGVVLYVSLSGEYMVSFVQSVEKSIMALQRGDTYLDAQTVDS